jgi:hypothetical protein
VHCEIPSIYGAFDGALADDGKSIAGTWAQMGQGVALTLKPITP